MTLAARLIMKDPPLHKDIGSNCFGQLVLDRYNDGLLLTFCEKCKLMIHFRLDREWFNSVSGGCRLP